MNPLIVRAEGWQPLTNRPEDRGYTDEKVDRESDLYWRKRPLVPFFTSSGVRSFQRLGR